MAKAGIIGGGAAGMFAAVQAAVRGHEVHLYEQNDKLGKKLFITGKGRCNFTNACSVEEFLQNIVSNGNSCTAPVMDLPATILWSFFGTAMFRSRWREETGRFLPPTIRPTLSEVWNGP